jgi:hypothetical protein
MNLKDLPRPSHEASRPYGSQAPHAHDLNAARTRGTSH